MAAGWVATGMALGAAAAASAAEPTGLLDFSPAERRRIAQHGPWPPPPARDAGNRVSGQPAAVALGRQLFFDARLSGDGSLACASCHQPERAFSDGLPRSVGREVLGRNAPSLWNAAYGRWYGWDGAFDSLWSQALHPLLSPHEMATSALQVAALVTSDGGLAPMYRASFGGAPGADPEATMVNVAKALGAFVASLVSSTTPFDAFRDALARGDLVAAARYPLAAQRGLRLFIGRGQCGTCHVGALFSNGEFGDIGLNFFVQPGVVDPGRHAGIGALKASPYNLLARWSDAPAAVALKTRHVQAQHRNFGEFKVPSLRNVADTGPYMHDGQLATLDVVLQHYAELDLERLHADGEQILKPLHFTAAEADDLKAFLGSLSDPGARTWPQRRPPQR